MKYNLALEISSPAFENFGRIPKKYTGRGEDISPEINLKNISPAGKSIAIVMVDLDIPLIKEYPHWLIWNLPVREIIPENIPHGDFGKATQGIAYGKNCYRGPKPPKFIRSPHRYRFDVYILDTQIKTPANARKKELLKNLSPYIIQRGSITGIFKN